MNESTFWELIESARTENNGDCEDQATSLAEKLSLLSAEDIIGFDQVLDQLMARSYKADLWDAAYLISGGCSDDGFDYFRGWLIGQGRAVFYDAVQDPDSLVDVAEPDVECESILYAALEAYESKIGGAMPRRAISPPDIAIEERTADQLASKFPKLWTRFGWRE